jgi:probable rRNA maturation factor
VVLFEGPRGEPGDLRARPGLGFPWNRRESRGDQADPIEDATTAWSDARLDDQEPARTTPRRPVTTMDESQTTGEEPPPRSPGTRAAVGIEVDVCDATDRVPPAVREHLTDLVRRAMTELGATGEARIRIVGDAEMTDLHARYKGDPSTTDVLTFDLRTTPDRADAPLDVDLVLCFDEARRQSDDRGHEPEAELLLYAVHGLLHCLGYDDADDADADRMHAEEDRVLTAIGVGPVFDAGRPSPGGAS